MSNNIHDHASADGRPAVLGGEPVVTLPADMTVAEWDRSRWGVEPTLSRRPRRGESVWPSWPQFSDASISDAIAILESQRDGGEGHPLGYLGPREQELEARYASMIGQDDQGRDPKVFAVSNGSVALVIAYLAVLTERFVVRGESMPAVPEALTSVRSFEATYTSMMKAGARPVFLDVDRRTGCVTADAVEAAITRSTALVAAPLLYDRGVDVPAIRRVAHQHGLRFVLDSAHAHMATWNGVHVSKYADIMTVSGQGSKIVTPGGEYGLIVVFDEVLAGLVAQIRNVGRGLDSATEWLPANLPVTAGENARCTELDAVLMGGSFDSYMELEPNRRRTLQVLQAELDGLGTPWRMLPAQPELDGVMYKATLVFDPEHSRANASAWAQIGWEAAREMLAHELVAEVAASYPGPWERASEYHPTSRPWTWEQLVPAMDTALFADGVYLADHCHELSHELIARKHAARQILAAVAKLDRAASDDAVLTWARETYNS